MKREIPILYKRKEECCGCSACYAICPKEAISMVEDEEGFEYPQIDESKCVRCYQCIRVCPIKAAQVQSEKIWIHYHLLCKETDIEQLRLIDTLKSNILMESIMMSETIKLLSKILMNVLIVIYESFRFSILFSFSITFLLICLLN